MPSSSPPADMRRPDEKVPWVLFKTDKEDVMPNYYTVMSLVFGVMAIVLKVKLHCWLCLLFSIAHVTTTKFSDMDMRQTFGSAMLAAMTFFSVYAQPQMKPPVPTETAMAG